MATMTTTYQIRAIQPAVVSALLDRDDAGRSPRLVVDTDGGSPLRCCLRLSRAGETLALVSYAPLRRWAQDSGVDPGAYDEVGPIFIHRSDCGGFSDAGFPDELRGSPRVLRAYGVNGVIARARLVAPDEQPEDHLEALFADPEVAVVHARALEFGCFTFEVRRATAVPLP